MEWFEKNFLKFGTLYSNILKMWSDEWYTLSVFYAFIHPPMVL